jgi:K+-transporting ATPase KdpF subunit
MIKIENNMKAKITSSFILLATVPASSDATGANNSNSYVVGGIIALLIMGYLIYSLIRPEKF